MTMEVLDGLPSSYKHVIRALDAFEDEPRLCTFEFAESQIS